jgi:hypothetical protein
MKKIIGAVLFLFVLDQSFAQERYIFVNLDINTPVSNTGWIKSTSSRGARAGYRQFINEKFSAGIDVGWSYFMDYKPKESFTTGTSTITTDYYNYIRSFSIAASGQYYPSFGNDTFLPYVGIGLGASSNEYRQYYNIYTDTDASWGFLARPEAGVLVRLSKRRSIGAMAGVHYDFSTSKSDSYGYSNFSVIGVHIGVMFLDW